MKIFYPLRRRRLLSGRSVESRSPLDGFYDFFLIILFNCVYAHNSNLNYKNILILKI